MYAWVIGRLVRRAFMQLRRDTAGMVVSRYAEDAQLRFPGAHPLAAHCRSRTEIAAWFERLFTALPDLRFVVEDVEVKGPPWNTRIYTRYTAHATARDGSRSGYRGMQFARMAWGKLTLEVVYPDTEAVGGLLGRR